MTKLRRQLFIPSCSIRYQRCVPSLNCTLSAQYGAFVLRNRRKLARSAESHLKPCLPASLYPSLSLISSTILSSVKNPLEGLSDYMKSSGSPSILLFFSPDYIRFFKSVQATLPQVSHTSHSKTTHPSHTTSSNHTNHHTQCLTLSIWVSRFKRSHFASSSAAMKQVLNISKLSLRTSRKILVSASSRTLAHS